MVWVGRRDGMFQFDLDGDKPAPRLTTDRGAVDFDVSGEIGFFFQFYPTDPWKSDGGESDANAGVEFKFLDVIAP